MLVANSVQKDSRPFRRTVMCYETNGDNFRDIVIAMVDSLLNSEGTDVDVEVDDERSVDSRCTGCGRARTQSEGVREIHWLPRLSRLGIILSC